MTLLEEVKQLHDDVSAKARETGSSELADTAFCMQALIVKHSQPLTPEAVVEWMGKPDDCIRFEDDGETFAVSVRNMRGLRLELWPHAFDDAPPCVKIWRIINLHPDRLKIIGVFPLQLFHSIADLETFVRVLGVEDV